MLINNYKLNTSVQKQCLIEVVLSSGNRGKMMEFPLVMIAIMRALGRGQDRSFPMGRTCLLSGPVSPVVTD